MKKQAFAYSLLKIVEWHREFAIANNRPNDFSTNNNFSYEKLLLLPYFLCTANGNRAAMFSIFDSFKADTIGYVENDIEKLCFADNNIERFFLVKTDHLVLTQEGEDILKTGANLDSEFVHVTGINDQFVSNKHINTLGEFFQHINHSISHLKKQGLNNNGGILTLSFDKLSKLSKIHSGYKMYSSGIVEYKRQDRPEIELKYLVNEMSIFASEKEHRRTTPLFELFHQ